MLVWILGCLVVLLLLLLLLDISTVSKLKGQLRFLEAALRGAKDKQEMLEDYCVFRERYFASALREHERLQKEFAVKKSLLEKELTYKNALLEKELGDLKEENEALYTMLTLS